MSSMHQVHHRPAFVSNRLYSYENKQNSEQSEKERLEKEAQDNAEDVEEVAKSFDQELAELNLYQRYKKLFKEYWYVLVPVHGVLSIVWFGSLILLSKR